MTVRSRKGVALIYVTVGMLAFFGIVSLAVDYGRVQLAKTQLRDAADAAALAGATALGDTSTVQNLCVQYAGDNSCDGTAVQIDPNQDIDFLNWDPTTRTYTVLTGSDRDTANAVRVWCRRTSDRQNAIPLMFARLLGQTTCNVSAYSIAAVLPPGYAVVGLDSITIQGNSMIASYWQSSGNIAGNAGNIASNGTISVGGSSNIDGTVWHTENGNGNGNGNVSGSSHALAVRTLSQPLSYPNPTAPGINSDSNIVGSFTYDSSTGDFSLGSNQTATLTGGTYVFNNVSIGAGATLNVSGPSAIYFSGNFSMNGHAATAQNDPTNLTVYSATINGSGPGSITLKGTSDLYATIMAPQSDITIQGTAAIYGNIVGKTITMKGTPNIYYNLTSPPGSVESVHLVDVAPTPR